MIIHICELATLWRLNTTNTDALLLRLMSLFIVCQKLFGSKLELHKIMFLDDLNYVNEARIKNEVENGNGMKKRKRRRNSLLMVIIYKYF